MKRALVIVLILFGASVNAQPPGEWMWIHGSNTVGSSGNFGTQGIPSPTNDPPALYEPCEWTDLNGNFWLFGGTESGGGNESALWKYNPTTNEWTWMKGPSIVNSPGVYGIQGVPSSTNNPPSRGYASASWVDLQGNLWMFGGAGGQAYSDLWKYEITTNEWTWMKGPNTTSQPGVYGTQGIPDTANNPGARSECSTAWTDNSGNLWLFGGYNGVFYNDLWKFDISQNMWTWMKGSQTTNQPGVYGTQGIEAPANTPGARGAHARWKDGNGKLWFFGGCIVVGNFFNDLWYYNTSTNNWAWINGSNLSNNMGDYGEKCLTSANNIPSARVESRAAWNYKNGGALFFFGGGTTNPVEYRNDLWMYCVSSNQWTWESGDTAVNSIGNWGTINTANPANRPSAKIGSVGWTDNNGHLYLFGGMNQYLGRYNDLWKYTIDTACHQCNDKQLSIDNYNVIIHHTYPNPTANSIMIETTNLLRELIIYSADGRMLKTIPNIQSSIFNIDMEDFSAGIYFFNCIGEKGAEMVKVVKY